MDAMLKLFDGDAAGRGAATDREGEELSGLKAPPPRRADKVEDGGGVREKEEGKPGRPPPSEELLALSLESVLNRCFLGRGAPGRRLESRLALFCCSVG